MRGMIVVISIVASVITSAITTKVLATHYFKIVDSYVEDMCDLTNRSNESTMAIIRRLEHVFATNRDMDIEQFVDRFLKS